MSERLAQQVAILSVIDPDTATGSLTSTGDVIDAKLYDKLMFILMAGVVTSSGKITLTVYKGTKSTAASITSTVTSCTINYANDDKQKIIDVDVSKEGNYRYYKPVLTTNGGTNSGSYAAALALGSSTRYHPASDNDLSSVASITYA